MKVGSTPPLQTYGRPIAQDLGNNHSYIGLIISCNKKNIPRCCKKNSLNCEILAASAYGPKRPA